MEVNNCLEKVLEETTNPFSVQALLLQCMVGLENLAQTLRVWKSICGNMLQRAKCQAAHFNSL